MGQVEMRASSGGSAESEWRLVRGRHRKWLLWGFMPFMVLLLLFRVAQWIWGGWSWDVAIGLLLPVAFWGFFTTQWRPCTRATADGLLIRGEFDRQNLIAWGNVRDIRADGGRWATAVTAHLTDGRAVRLPGVRPDELENVLAHRPG